MSTKNNLTKTFNPLPPGILIDYWGNSEPDGWIFLSGKTIGNTGSGATHLASPVTEDLFKHLWNNFSNSICPVSGGRGASADADWSNNKNIQLSDGRGSTNMHSIVALGTNNGTEGVTLLPTQLPTHTHYADFGHSGSLNHYHTYSSAMSDLTAGSSISVRADHRAAIHDSNYNPTDGITPIGGTFGPPPLNNTTITHNHTYSVGSMVESGDQAHNNIQPTIICNKLIKL